MAPFLGPAILQSLQSSVGMGLASSSATATPATPLSEEMQARLAESLNSAMSRSWSVPTSARPLNEQELCFLRTHSVEEIRTHTSSNPFMKFCMQVIQEASVQVISITLQNSLAESAEEAKLTEHEEEKKADSKKAHSHGKERRAVSSGPIAEDSSQTETLSSEGRDPFLKKMKNIASRELAKRVKTSVQRLIQNEMDQIGAQVGEDRMFSALGRGQTFDEAARDSVQAVKAHNDFVRHAGTVIKAAVASGVFLSKAEEIGWQGAAAEMTQSVVTGFAAKRSAQVIGSFVMCTNPVWCVGIVSTVIADIFTPTETAPSSHDMRFPPLPSAQP